MNSGRDDGSAASPAENAYLPDQPIRRKADDRFERGTYAARVAWTIATRQDSSSLAIGLYAPWGEGKTSVLHLIEEALSEQPHVIPVWFNPWTFATQEDLIRGLFSAMAAALKRDLKKPGEKIGKHLQTYGLAVSAIGSLALQKNLGSGASDLGKQLSTVSLEKERERVSAMLLEEGKRIVVFMDDIDRLDRTEIQAVFKLVKLTADLEQIIYLMAFDDELVADSLQERYGSGDPLAGRRFLEKIIQVPLRLPRVNQKTLRRYTLDTIEQALNDARVPLTQEQIQDFLHAYGIGLEARISTPRVAKLYANAISFALPILQGEVDPVEVMLVEGVRVLFPRLYDAIREEPELFLDPTRVRHYSQGITPEHKQALKDQIATVLSPYSTAEREAALRLLRRLFPRLKDVYENHSYDASFDTPWAAQKKVASYAYFDRYFSYAIPHEDFSDREVVTLLERAKTAGQDDLQMQLQKSVTSQNAITFVQKLRSVEDTCDLVAGTALAAALAAVAELFPIDDGMMTFGGSRAQIAVFISEIISRLPDEDARFQAAQTTVRLASTPGFARDLVYWFSTAPKAQRRNNDKEPVLPIEKTEELSALLIERIQLEAGSEDLFQLYLDDEVRALLHTWSKSKGREDTQAYLSALLDKDPTKIFRIIKMHMGTASSMEDGRPLRSGIERETYNAIASIIDPDLVVDHLLALVPTASNPIKDLRHSTIEEHMAHQFIVIHQASAAESS